MTLVWAVLMGFLLAASAFFAMAETSFVGLSKLRLRHMVDRGIKQAKGLQQLIARMDEVITSIVLANNFVNDRERVTVMRPRTYGIRFGISY